MPVLVPRLRQVATRLAGDHQRIQFIHDATRFRGVGLAVKLGNKKEQGGRKDRDH